MSGSAGWRIAGDGSIEANDGTFRGVLEATAIDIGGDDATSWHVDSDGNMIRPTMHDWTPDTMHVHDLNATILHLMGIDHKKLTYRYQGRDFRLTDVHGHVVKDILA